MRRLVAIGLIAAPASAWAQASALYVTDSVWVAEDLLEGSDRDQNDVGLDYNKRCVVDDATESLLTEDIRFVARVAGASRTNQLVLRFPVAPSRVGRSEDGGATFTDLCDGDCGADVLLYADFRDAFAPRGVGFVNTDGSEILAGRPNVVEVVYPSNVPAPTDGLGMLYCAVPDFAIDRPDLTAPIDADTLLPGRGMPLVGSFPYLCAVGDTCPPDALVPWSAPTERVPIEIAYGAPFVRWLDDQTDLDPCTRGVDCTDEDWFLFPETSVVDGAGLATLAPLPPAPRCDDGEANGGEADVDCGGTVCDPCGVLRVNVAWNGAVVGPAFDPSVSADGEIVAFLAAGTASLVPEDTNAFQDVYVRDRPQGTTTLVSVATSGAAGNQHSGSPSISADGRYVAFESYASNLVIGDTNGTSDAFVRDMVTGTTERVSVDSAGAQGDNESTKPRISADGRYVAFASRATNLVPSDTNGVPDVFVHDLQTGTTVRVNVDTSGVQANNGYLAPMSISADGRYVAFESTATNLVPGDTNGVTDVFVRDLQASTTERVSLTSGGGQSTNYSSIPGISPDGTLVGLRSLAVLASGGTAGTYQVYVRDRVAGTTTLASRATGAGAAANGDTQQASFSADGRYVAFYSAGTNLVTPPAPGGLQYNVYVRDLDTLVTTRLSVAHDGSATNSNSGPAQLSADGTVAVFASTSTNLVPGDDNGVTDIFVVPLP